MEEQFWDSLEKLDVFKSAGPDEMHPRVLKELPEIISEPLWWDGLMVPYDFKSINLMCSVI